MVPVTTNQISCCWVMNFQDLRIVDPSGHGAAGFFLSFSRSSALSRSISSFSSCIWASSLSAAASFIFSSSSSSCNFLDGARVGLKSMATWKIRCDQSNAMKFHTMSFYQILVYPLILSYSTLFV